MKIYTGKNSDRLLKIMETFKTPIYLVLEDGTSRILNQDEKTFALFRHFMKTGENQELELQFSTPQESQQILSFIINM